MKLKAIIYQQIPDGKGGYTLKPLTSTSTSLSAGLAAPILGVSKATVYRLCEQGVLPCNYPSPGRVAIALEDLMDYKIKTRDPEFFERQMDFDFEQKNTKGDA